MVVLRVHGRILAEQREVPRRNVGQGVEHGGPRRVVARGSEDLENGGAEERVEQGGRRGHGVGFLAVVAVRCVRCVRVAAVGGECVVILYEATMSRWLGRHRLEM